MALTWGVALWTVSSTQRRGWLGWWSAGAVCYRTAMVGGRLGWSGPPVVAELAEGLGELAAEPLVLLGEFAVAVGWRASSAGVGSASLVRWRAGTGVLGWRRPWSRSRWISSRMSGWV